MTIYVCDRTMRWDDIYWLMSVRVFLIDREIEQACTEQLIGFFPFETYRGFFGKRERLSKWMDNRTIAKMQQKNYILYRRQMFDRKELLFKSEKCFHRWLFPTYHCGYRYGGGKYRDIVTMVVINIAVLYRFIDYSLFGMTYGRHFWYDLLISKPWSDLCKRQWTYRCIKFAGMIIFYELFVVPSMGTMDTSLLNEKNCAHAIVSLLWYSFVNTSDIWDTYTRQCSSFM